MLLKKCIEDEPDTAYWWYHLGITYKAASMNKKAISALETWISKAETISDSNQDLSIGYAAYIGCLIYEKLYNRIVEEAPKWDFTCKHNPDWNFNYAVALDAAGYPGKAVETLVRNEQLRGKPISVSTYDADTVGWKMYAVKAGALMKLGMLKEATEAYKGAYHTNPTSIEIISALFVNLVRLQDFQAAETVLERLFSMIGSSPVPEAVAKAHADLLLQQGKIEDALFILSKFPEFNLIVARLESGLITRCRYNDLKTLKETVERIQSGEATPEA